MRLSDYLAPDLVLLDLGTTGVEETLRAFVRRLEESGRIEGTEDVERALNERERTHTTALGNGVALPHATIPGLEEPLILVGVAPDGVAFAADDERPRERLFFVLLSPANQAGTHIKLLARIVRLVRIPDFVDSLISAGSGEALIERIQRVDAQHV